MSKRRYRVLHLITRLDLGGAQQNTLYCAANHDREQFEVHLLAGAGGMLDDEARRIDDAQVDLLPWLKHEISPGRDAEALCRLVSCFRSRKIDLVHTHSSKAGILGRLAARVAGVPAVVHTIHGWSFNPTQAAPRRAAYVGMEKMAAGLTDRLVAVSARNRDEGLELGIGRPDQYVVLHSGIDVDAFRAPTVDRAELRRGLGFDDSHLVVGAVACLKPQKAPLDLVRAAAAAHAEEPRLRFFIAGDGELRPQVESLIRQEGLQEIVRPLGWRRDVPDLLHACDLFLLTSLHEGLPRSVLQAMASGAPVVATAVDGTPEVVEDGRTGLLVPPGRPAEAAQALLRMVRDDGLRERCVEEARRRLGRSFDIRAMVRDLDRLYSSLLQS